MLLLIPRTKNYYLIFFQNVFEIRVRWTAGHDEDSLWKAHLDFKIGEIF